MRGMRMIEPGLRHQAQTASHQWVVSDLGRRALVPLIFRPRQSSLAQAVITATHGEMEVQSEAMDFDRLGEAMADRPNAVAPLSFYIRYQANGDL